MHRGVRLRAEGAGRGLRHRHRAEQMACADDVPADALPLVRKAQGRRSAHERDGRAATQEHHTLQPDLHQPGHHRDGRRHPGLLHHVHGVARSDGTLQFGHALPHIRVRPARPFALHADNGG